MLARQRSSCAGASWPTAWPRVKPVPAEMWRKIHEALSDWRYRGCMTAHRGVSNAAGSGATPTEPFRWAEEQFILSLVVLGLQGRLHSIASSRGILDAFYRPHTGELV